MGANTIPETDAEKLERFAMHILRQYIHARRETRAWGELNVKLTFEAGQLKQVRTIDDIPVRADILPNNIGSQSSTVQTNS